MKHQNPKSETEVIRYMIHQRLTTSTEVQVQGEHPDEDTICAFIEGRLEEAGASQMVSHLIACGPCRRTTAQVSRFDSQVEAEDDSTAEDSGPGRLRLVLEGLATRVFPASEEDVVFAYQNPPEQQTEITETANDEPAQKDSRPNKETETD